MSHNWVRRGLVAATAGAMAVAGLTLGGITGTAAAAVPTAGPSGVTTTPAAVGAVVRPASAAAAAVGNPGEFDVYEDPNFQHGASLTDDTIPDLSEDGLNDVISSLVNNSGTSMCLFTDPNFQGQKLLFIPGEQIAQLAPNIDNSVSSVEPC